MKTKKKVIVFLLTLLTIGNCMSVLAAAETALPAQPIQAEDTGIAPHAEETVWYERYYEGRWQKRLWSITNGCWLTDWIDID